MHDALTRADIKKLTEELEYRRTELMPPLLDEVRRTRAFGDLSENYEYKTAKQALNKNKARIRYLEGMIKTARIITSDCAPNVVGLNDRVRVCIPEDDAEQVIQIVTTVRTDPRRGYISRESPFGKAVLGRRAGETVTVEVSEDYSYACKILSVEKSPDDDSAPLMQY